MAVKLRRRKGEEPESSLPPISMVDLAARPSRPRDADRITRRKLDTWDRVKYLVLLSLLFSVFWWQKLANNPIKSVADGFWDTVSAQAWIWVLLGLEILRQTHFVVAERWPAYYRFWRRTIFGRFEGRTERIDPWTRFRVGRVLRILFWVVVAGVIVGQFTDQNPSATTCTRRSCVGSPSTVRWRSPGASSARRARRKPRSTWTSTSSSCPIPRARRACPRA